MSDHRADRGSPRSLQGTLRKAAVQWALAQMSAISGKVYLKTSDFSYVPETTTVTATVVFSSSTEYVDGTNETDKTKTKKGGYVPDMKK